MSGISKRVNGSWVSGDERVMKTATDTITTLPADVYADGTAATIGLVGNMSQTGTPTPQNPIQPQETGERTGNLFDGIIEVGGLDTTTGEEVPRTDRRRSEFIEIEADTNYNFSRTMTAVSSNLWILFYDSNKNYITNSSKGTSSSNATWKSPVNAKYVRWYVTADGSYDKMMIVKGSTAPSSYIPPGYKIPILSANTTTPIYLGEVETTRKIKKLVLTGEETWFLNTSVSRDNTIYVYTTAVTGNVEGNSICSHFAYDATSYNDDVEGFHLLTGYGGLRYRVDRNLANTLNDWKSYLAAQYAAGTPVCVWYVLAEPTTGIVNEPLRKIGEYADTVSGITIPTIAGADTVSVDTTLQPSEVSVTYHGWHTGTVHERESGSWD